MVIECPVRSSRAPIPSRMQRLPRDPDRPYFPVPWFVAWLEGKPDYRVIAPGKIVEAVRKRTCWLCGQPLGTIQAFVLGSMCAVNRITSEPPCHRECAEYAVQVCPFLTSPRMRRNTKELPGNIKDAPGIPLDRNPGVSLLWMTGGFRIRRVEGGVLFEVRKPREVTWWCEGRAATREEVLGSIEGGLGFLRRLAERDGPDAIRLLNSKVSEALTLLPAA